jgi:lysozyme
MARKINDLGLALIKSAEGLRLEAYRCPAGVLTIGYGSTGPHVREGMIITPGEAERFLMLDLKRFETGVEAMTDMVPTNDNQFSAMVCLSFNIGLNAFATSTVLKKHKKGDYEGAGNAFLLWNKARGQVLKGLVKRREDERSLYLGELG